MRAVVLRDLALLAAGLCAVYAGLCSYMFFKQESYVYFPDSRIWTSPAEEGLAFEEVRLRTADGIGLGAWWVPAEAPRGALAFCHGNGGNIADRLDKVAYFHGLGLSVLIFDYRGYGTSGGTPCEEGTYRDLDAALNHLEGRRGLPSDRILLYGESLGGAVAVEAAARRPAAALIVESTFTSVVGMARKYYPWLPARWLARIRYDSLGRIGAVRCPVLVLHSPEDDIVPFEMGEALFAAAHRPKRFARTEGDHNTGGITESPGARRELEAFLEEVLGPAPLPGETEP